MSMIFRSLFVIAAVAAIAGGATFAYFSDTATVAGTTFSAGTMNLDVDRNPIGDAQDWVKSFNVEGDTYKTYLTGLGLNPEEFYAKLGTKNLKPGSEGNQTIDIRKTGNVDGIAKIKFNRTSSADQLRNNLKFTLKYSANNDHYWNTIASGTLAEFEGKTYTLGEITGDKDLSGENGKVATIKIEWSVPTSAGNEIQGDSVVVDAVITLEQAR